MKDKIENIPFNVAYRFCRDHLKLARKLLDEHKGDRFYDGWAGGLESAFMELEVIGNSHNVDLADPWYYSAEERKKRGLE